MSDLTAAEQVAIAAMLADLYAHGYVLVENHNGLDTGMRVRHCGERWYEAFANGTGEIVAITEKPNSPWSRSWGMPDVEMVVAFDKAKFEGGSRLSQLAQYHVAKAGS